MNGILMIDKPSGVTSQVVINRVRRVTGERRVGHCGTLDPLASGVLPVMIGQATKACDYLMEHEKTYTAAIQFGRTTDSEDVTGETLSVYEGSLPTLEQVREAANRFIGEIEQVPPMYSALKQNGQKLVDLARKGITVERQPRRVVIHALRVYEQDGVCCLDVRCSRGTYIRTLCADIGTALGCGACMSALRRTSVGKFTLEQSVPLDVLRDDETFRAEEHLLSVEQVFSDLPQTQLPPFFARLYGNGERIALKKIKLKAGKGDLFRVYTADGRFTVGEISENDGELRLGAKIFL